MAFLSGFSFVTPWALSAFLLLPILWQLLRTTAPKPKVIAFPAVRLLQELHDHRLLAARTPWWLLILRSLIVTLLIMALAGPTLNAPTATTVSDSPHIIIVDNDWSVMDRWDPRKKEIQRLINQTKNSVHTTYLAATSQPEPFIKKTPDQLAYQISQLKAQPWPTRRMALLQHLQNLRQKMDQPLKISWIANGIKNEDDQNFAQELTKLGKVEYITENTPPPLHPSRYYKMSPAAKTVSCWISPIWDNETPTRYKCSFWILMVIFYCKKTFYMIALRPILFKRKSALYRN